ncbi:MAG: XdhC family protein [Phycisphaerales bacterium]
MTEDLHVLTEAARLLRGGHPFVMATVISCKGSTPRNAGARMNWRPGSDAAVAAGPSAEGQLTGTVGGGQFEHLAIGTARECLATGRGRVERYVLSEDADQCCGGVMEVYFEYHAPRARVVLFGAGHVARELAALLSAGPIETVVVDDRVDWNSAVRFPEATRVLAFDEGVRTCGERSGVTLACVMTCSHDTDFDLLRAILSAGSRPAFLGLIGSRSKRACLFGRLVAAGIAEDLVRAVECPIGIGDTGKEPKLVAISIAAQLLTRARILAGDAK